MGTWDVGPFDNDGASDWAWELEESEGLDVLKEAISSQDGYLEAPEGEIAIAAAAVLAVFVGESLGVPDKVARWVDSHRHLDVRDLKADALRALDAVVSDDSELKQLWDESVSPASWLAVVDRLREVLVGDWPAPSAGGSSPTKPPAAAPSPSTKPRWRFWR